MLRVLAVGVLALALAAGATAADFGTPGGPEPANLAAAAARLRSDAYDVELMISFGTSKGGSAGHLALAIREPVSGDDFVYSANFYADRQAGHERDHYTDDLMVRVPKLEYLYGTRSTLGAKASFGLDYGEVYKRSVVGVRAYGVPAGEAAALMAFFARLNADYRARVRDTEYHDGEVRYDYLRLNCAKTIGSAFRYGAGYKDLDVTSAAILSGRRVVAALNANIPTEMAMKIIREWDARGYNLDAVLYRKYMASPYVEPRDEEKVAFRDLPDRFPSVLSRDFLKDQGEYRDFDNLYAMYLLYNLATYSVTVDAATQRLVIDRFKKPTAYPVASRLAYESAKADSENYSSGARFRAQGTRVGETEPATN